MILLLGGARSGKSSLAVSIASRLGAPVRFVATARADDEEMARRIEDHRLHRPADWTLVEAPIDVVEALAGSSDGDTLILDCVTLWISNLMVERDDATILEMVDDSIAGMAGRTGQTIVVSNEVGSGVVPMDAVGRRFRDLQGRANQRYVDAADNAYLVVAGKTLRLGDADDVL